MVITWPHPNHHCIRDNNLTLWKWHWSSHSVDCQWKSFRISGSSLAWASLGPCLSFPGSWVPLPWVPAWASLSPLKLSPAVFYKSSLETEISQPAAASHHFPLSLSTVDRTDKTTFLFSWNQFFCFLFHRLSHNSPKSIFIRLYSLITNLTENHNLTYDRDPKNTKKSQIQKVRECRTQSFPAPGVGVLG